MNKNIKYIIENIVNFNPVDYQDNENDIITNNDITTVIYKYFPKTREELEKIIIERLKENIKEPYLNDINTSEITDMSNLFSSQYSDYLYKNGINSKKIKKLDLSNFNTSKCTNMTGMFWKCSSLEELDISNWDTSKVTDMSWMFFRCESLKELNISGWDISKVTDMGFMFYGCKLLKKLDISDQDISSETDTRNMFDGCNKTIIPAYYKSGLMENNLNFNPADYIDDEDTVISHQTIKSVFITPKTTDELKKLVAHRFKENPTNPYLLDINTSLITDMSGLFASEKDNELAGYNEYFKIFDIDLNSPIYYTNKLILDLSTWNTSNVTDMSWMFYSCYMSKLDISNFDTSNVTNMDVMFAKCTLLEKIDVSKWDTSKVMSMGGMFFDCESLIELDLSTWDVSNVSNMFSMFTFCESLKALNLSNWSISNTILIDTMFTDCKSLETLNLLNWNIDNNKNISGMFDQCDSLKTVYTNNPDIIKEVYKSSKSFIGKLKSILNSRKTKHLKESIYGFNPSDYNEDENNLLSSQEIEECIIKPKDKDELCKLICKRYEQNPEYPYLLDIDTSDITDMSGIFSPILSAGIVSGNPYLNKYFSYRESLKIKILDLSTWDTSKVTDMSYMFWSCSQECIKEIKIKNFDTSNVTNMKGMFGFCNNITKLDLSNFDTSNVKNMENMFDNCMSLIDLDLSNFNVVNVASMARMFRNCNSLVSLNINGWDMSNVTDISYMFSNCYKLTDIDFTNFNVNVINTEFGLWGTFSGNDALKYKYDISKI